MSTITTYSKAALDKLIADWRQNLQGYKAQTVSGSVTISPAVAGTFALDLTADTTLTIDGKLGQTVVLDVVTGGKKLTVVNGPVITADGVYALLLTRGKWAGGATGTASTGGSTGSGGSPSTGGSTGGSTDTGGSTGGSTSGAEVAHLDLSSVTDGTAITDVAMSNGTKFVNISGALTVKGKKIVGNGSAKFNVTLPKQRHTWTYSMAARGGDFTVEEVRFLIVSSNTLVPVMIRINNDGFIDLPGLPDTGYTSTMTPGTAPLSGTCVITADAPTGTITATIGGTTIASMTKADATSTAKILGAGVELVTQNAATTPAAVSALKVEAIA